MDRVIPQKLSGLFASAERTYMNPVLQRDDIKKDNTNKMGIYCWVNMTNGDIYVGRCASVTRGLYQRVSDYYQPAYLAHFRNENSLICQALQKYGMSAFALLILEYCETERDTVLREQYYLSELDTAYNVQKSAGHSLGMNAGVPQTEEHKKNAWDAQWGAKSVVHGPYDCPETTNLLAQQKNPITKYTPKTHITIQDVVYKDVFATFYSWRAAGNALNLPHSSLIKHVKNHVGRPYNGRYKITVRKTTEK